MVRLRNWTEYLVLRLWRTALIYMSRALTATHMKDSRASPKVWRVYIVKLYNQQGQGVNYSPQLTSRMTQGQELTKDILIVCSNSQLA